MTPLDKLREDSLVGRLAAAQSLHGTDEARSRVTSWLAEIADAPAGKALGRLCGATPKLDALLTCVAGGSDYLWELVRASPQRLPSQSTAGTARRLQPRWLIGEAMRAPKRPPRADS